MVQAETSAARGHELAAEDCRAQLARIINSKDFDATVREHRFLSHVVEEALAGLMGEYGDRLALSGNWHDGCSLIKEARQRNPGSLGYYETDLALCSYFSGDYPQAAMWIKKSPVPSSPGYHVIAAAVFGEGGYKVEAVRERAWLDENQPALVKNMRQDVSTPLARSQDIEFLPQLAEESRPKHRGLIAIL